MTDPETAAAVDALTHRLRNRDPETDLEVFALEFITALRARGWRPTEARPAPAWQRPAGSGRPPTDEWRAARAELEARLGHRGVDTDEGLDAALAAYREHYHSDGGAT